MSQEAEIRPGLSLGYHVAPRGFKRVEADAFQVASGDVLALEDGSWRTLLRWNGANRWWLDDEGQVARGLEIARREDQQSEIALAVASERRVLSGFLDLRVDGSSLKLSRYDHEAQERQIVAAEDEDGWLLSGGRARGEITLSVPAADEPLVRIEPGVRVRPSALST